MSENNHTKSKGRGGARKGAGRKKGAATKRTREIANKAVQDGITPLEVMLGAMRQAWESGELNTAAGHAKDAAPYIHPRLQAIEHSTDEDTATGLALFRLVPVESGD